MIPFSLPTIILGAGMSGLSAARELHALGEPCIILEKSRGVGGRMATRRFAEGVHDTGAQYVSVRSPEFQLVMDEALAEGDAKIWAHGFPYSDAPLMVGHPRYCGRHGMTTLPKFLAREKTIMVDWEVSKISQTSRGWLLINQRGESIEGKALIITAPAPQALKLLRPIESLLLPSALLELERVEYDPCIAVVLALDRPSTLPPPGGMFIIEGKLRWIADNQQKGISPVPSLTLHAAPDYSRANYDDSDDELIVDLAQEARRFYGGAKILEGQVRRWKYSQPTVTTGKPFVVACENPPLIVVGDGMLESKVEGAFLSGYHGVKWLRGQFTS